MSDCAERAIKRFDSDLVDYLSVRITISHIDVPKMLTAIFKEADYLCYRHKGGKTHKEHVHVLVPDVTLASKLKDRLRNAGFKGNQTFSIKGMHNGLQHGIQYCAKEDSNPIVQGDYAEIIATAPKWVDKRMDSYLEIEAKPRTERNWELSYSNIVPQAVSFARERGLTEWSFKDVVKEMIRKTKWKPVKQMFGLHQGGFPRFMVDDFEYRLGRISDYDWKWMDARGFVD